MPASDNDPLELVMTTRVKGAKEARDAAVAIGAYDLSEDKAAKTAARALGTYEKLAKARELLNRAYQTNPGFLSPDRFRDIELDFKRRQSQVDRLSQPDATRGSLTAKAFLSSRYGKGGGMMPLVGQSLDAIGGEGTAKGVGGLITGIIDGPIGKFGGVILALGKAGVEVVKAMYQLADASSRITQRFSDLRGGIGGSTGDAARNTMMSRITGVNGESAAKAFQERITSDPLAMGAAGGLGIHNRKAPYGNLAIGGNYNQAVESVSRISDPNQRRRTAMILGIEQEVNRYSLLSGRTRGNLANDAGTTGRVNGPGAERRAAEFTASQERFSQAKDNFTTAIGGAFAENFTPFINSMATALNVIADVFNVLNEKTKLLQPILFPLVGLAQATNNLQNQGIPTTPYEAISKMFNGGGGGKDSALSANTIALNANNAHLERLNGIIGGGERAQSALPSAMRGANLSRAVTMEGLRLGSL